MIQHTVPTCVGGTKGGKAENQPGQNLSVPRVSCLMVALPQLAFVAVLPWVVLSIVRPHGTCKLLGSEGLWFLDMSPGGPLFSWHLHWVLRGGHRHPAPSSCFTGSWRWGCLQRGSAGDPRSPWAVPPPQQSQQHPVVFSMPLVKHEFSFLEGLLR